MVRWTEAMRQGRYADAWALSRQTLAERDPAARDDPSLPYHLRWVWDGRPVEGRDVLVRCYHGLGDTIQFARFLPRLAGRASSLTVEAPPHLLGLLKQIGHGIRFLLFDPAHPAPPAEVDVEITELDLALRVPPDEVPVPYLDVAATPLPAGTVAFCYGAGDWDVERSVPASSFAPLCRQFPCLTLMPQPTELPVLNPDGCPLDIGVTASLVAGADLVVTVDTMIAHLAGAMAKPTWLLLKADPDWRWPIDRARSAWYPSMRLYHQPSAGDWDSVIDRVLRDLADRYSCPRSASPA